MKLRNKLIPIFSVASVATVAAPLMSSCGNVETSSMEMIDVMHGYVPTETRAEGATNLDQKQVQDIYINDIKANPQILVQDMAWYESLALKYRLYYATFGQTVTQDVKKLLNNNETNDFDPEDLPEGSFIGELYSLYGLLPADPDNYEKCFTMIPQVANFGMSDISVDQVKLVNPNTSEEETINTISLKFNYEFDYQLVGDCAYGINRYVAQRDAKISLTSEYKNIPFVVRFDSQYAMWVVEPTGWAGIMGRESTASADTTWILNKLTNYSLDFDLKATYTDTIKDYNGNVDTYTYDESKGGVVNSASSFQSWIQGSDTSDFEYGIRQIVFNFGSYHLYDVMGPRWTSSNLGNGTEIDYSRDSSTQFRTTLPGPSYQWTYSEQVAGTAPVKNQTTGITAKLLNGSDLTFDAMLLIDDVWTKVGTVTLSDYTTSSGCGTINDQGLSMSMEFTATFTIDTEEHTTLFYKDLASQDFSITKFVIPANTLFRFETYVADDPTSKETTYTAKELKYTLDADVTCYWSAKNKKVAA